jgi:TolB-like protein/DNA-binding winged helix-turn-helix (wHTH) protein
MTKPLTLTFDGWTLYRESGELERDGKRVRLQDLPFQILDELLGRPGEVVTREQLVARLWPKTIVDFDANLNSGVRRLRAALGDDADAPRYIETLPRRGYRYIGDPPRAGVAAEPTAIPSSPARRPRRGRMFGWAGVCVALVASGALVVYLSRTADAPVETTSPNAETPRLRLAVLPFENLSPDPANAFFTDGLHEEILSAIANRATNLEVISRTTMMMYRAEPKSVHDIARELNVTHVLEGSVRREGHSVRLTLQLIDARNDVHLWSKNFNRQLTDAITLQSAVAEEVGSQLAVKLSGDIGDLPQPANPEAYDLFLKARLGMQTVTGMRSPREQSKALALLDNALALDDGFAAAYLQRARVRMNMFISSQNVSEANLVALRADLAAARRLMGDAPPLLVSEATYAGLVEFDTAKALRALRAAEQVNPRAPEVCHGLARALSQAETLSDALVYYERAATLDPGNPVITADWATVLKTARRPEDSLRLSRAFEARYPGRTTYGLRLFGFTGQVERFAREVEQVEATGEPEARLAARFDLLVYSRRLNELAALVERSGLTMLPQGSRGGFTIPAIGRKPVAELHGWAKMFETDAAAAARDGRVLLDFVAQEPVTKWNAWYLRMLAAEGALFAGDRPGAAQEARRALAMAPQGIHPGIERYSRSLAARVLAWAGRGDEAVDILEQLSTQYPMAGPADITRDPFYAIPLAGNARYQALERKLEAEIAINQQWRESD